MARRSPRKARQRLHNDGDKSLERRTKSVSQGNQRLGAQTAKGMHTPSVPGDVRFSANNILKNVHAPMLILDTDLRVVSANRAFYHTFEMSEEQTENRLFPDLGLVQCDTPHLLALLQEMIPKRLSIQDFEMTKDLIRKGRRILLLHARMTRKGEEPPLILVYFSDITERKQAEEVQRRAQEELQAEIAQRKATEAALARHVEELARSNRELEQFAYVASHDLQEPLRMVASYTQLLAKRYKGKLDKDADEFIAYAVDGANRMQGLINDLLAYSRVGTRGKPFKPTDGESLLNRAIGNLQISISERAAQITHDPLPTVTADGAQLEQVFQNLLGNALKYCTAPRPEVHVRAERNGHEWVFFVKDNGIGMEPGDTDRIFLLFQRLHAKAEYPGTGLGLAICKKIVERHGGRIWVESRPGEGSTFAFSIPDRVGSQA